MINLNNNILLQIETIAANSNSSCDDFFTGLWSGLVVSKDATNKKIMRKLAKELNVYPRGANVYAELRNYLLNGIAI